MKKRKRAKRKLRNVFKIIFLSVFTAALLFWWQMPGQGKYTPEEFITELNEKMSSGYTYQLSLTAREFIRNYPGHEEIYRAYLVLGGYNLSAGRNQDALDNFKAAADKNAPEQALGIALFQSSVACIRLKEYEKALEFTSQARKITENIDEMGYLFYQEGFLKNRLKKFKEALESLIEAKRYRPDQRLLISIMLEEAYSQQNLYSLKIAELIYQEIITKFPDQEKEVEVAAKSLEKLNRVREMEKMADKSSSELDQLLLEEHRLFY